MLNRSPERLLTLLFPPMLATLAAEPPADAGDWSFELKYDGFRAVAALVGGELALWSRNELDLAARFPRIAEALKKIKAGELVLDGEIVALDKAGVPRFQLLQGGAGGKAVSERIYVFDILWRDGEDLRARPYTERRAILETILRKPPAGVAIASQIAGEGRAALEQAAASGWEGIIAKRRDSPYEPRRSKRWLKIKVVNSQELAIIGFTVSTASPREIGALHLAWFGKDGRFHYAGKVGTGFSAKSRAELRKVLELDTVPEPVASDVPRSPGAHWVRPRLVAQVSFTEWTADNRLRHPSFLGLRDDKAPEDVVRETVASEPATAGSRATKPSNVARKKPPRRTSRDAAAGARKHESRVSRVVLTHPDRVLYPLDGITKADVAAYYEAVAGPMIAALRDRPLSLEHWNEGLDHPSWFHQNLGREAPGWLHTVDTPSRTTRGTVRHLVVEGPDELRWLAQMSVLTVHMWSSRSASLDSPDWIVFDLDPAKGKGIEQAVEAAIIMRGLLEHLELPSVPKTSGRRGIHVLVPLAPGYTHEEAGKFASDVAAAVTRQVPSMTVERALAKRRGRLYLDCLQNAYGKTIVAPYSPRAVAGAPVSAPLRWEEVNARLDPLKFNIRTMPGRLDKVGDLFSPLLHDGVRLPRVQ